MTVNLPLIAVVLFVGAVLLGIGVELLPRGNSTALPGPGCLVSFGAGFLLFVAGLTALSYT